MNLGTAIKNIRKHLQLSQTEFASKIDITQTSLSQLENGVSHPSQKTIKKITEVFKIPEALIYILSIDEHDAPEERKEIYTMLFPSVRKLVLEILNPDILNKDKISSDK